MKILQINSVCGIGSTGRIATDLHSILIENGHTSKISYGRDNAKNIAFYAESCWKKCRNITR